MNLKSIFENNDEKPLDNIPADGGYTAIFRTETAEAAITICLSTRGGSLWGVCAAAGFTICPAEE